LVACSPQQSADFVSNEQVQNRGANKDNWWDSLPRPEWSAYERIEQDQDWFEVYRVADDIFAIYEPGQFEEVISFLITGQERALLFDTGLGIGDMRRVVSQLTDLDVIVLNSHSHYDHIGGNYQFDTVYGRDTAYTRARTRGSSPDVVAEFLQEGWVWKPLPAGFVKAEYRSRPFEIDRIIDEGDVIDLGGRRLEILSTPGHAPDATCLLDRENRMLFTGDTFYLAPLYAHLEGSNLNDYAETAARLAGLADEFDVVLTAHNVPVVEARYMTALGAAFAAIEAGTANDFTISDGYSEYHFDGFSVIIGPQTGKNSDTAAD
ncbi:MAG: MBL fold metallo-hydrolase, partial [Gammaproteobacteria bacterium]|nr:MBL fold metallo-hydrolase [Gammaproteobacteria bacterium]